MNKSSKRKEEGIEKQNVWNKYRGVERKKLEPDRK
jgi:hypothetical protein